MFDAIAKNREIFMTIATNSEKLMTTDAKAISKPGLREKRRVDWRERIFHGLFLT
ncbi:phosphate ABC transporter permease subunit PstC, partial [Vibrio owensii]